MKVNTDSSPSKSWGVIVAIILAGCLLAVVIFIARSHQSPVGASVSTSATSTPVVVSPTPSATPNNDTVSVPVNEADPVLGSATAPITVIEFTNFSCAACRQFQQSTFLDIQKNLIDTGKVRLVYKDFPVGSNEAIAKAAALAARCAGAQDKFWQYSALLFQADDIATSPALNSIAEQLGIDTNKFAKCLTDGSQDNTVTKSVQDAISAGITNAPTFVINGKLFEGPISYATLQNMVSSYNPTPSP